MGFFLVHCWDFIIFFVHFLAKFALSFVNLIQFKFTFTMNKKHIEQQVSKMQAKKNQFPQQTTMDVLNSPKVQFVSITIESLHIHVSGMN